MTMETIIAALVTGLLTLIGVIITNMMSNRKIENELKTAQAVTNERIEELTREVRAHNNFAQRVPVVENEIKNIYHKINYLHSNGNE